MKADTLIRAIYVAGMISMFALRLTCRIRTRNGWVVETRFRTLEVSLLTFAFIGMLVVPLVYVFSDTLSFADYVLPSWTGWAGTLIFLAALWLLWRAHSDLGQNWSQTLALREEHELITHGVYRRVRHPMYAAFWLWAIAEALLLHNRIAGFSQLVSLAGLCFLRVPREERMMLDRFGGEYQDYMNRTGRVLPRWR